MIAPYSEGPLDAKICFIGEAPGQEEVEARRPFVGSAGRTLDRCLSRAGINRSECRIENVVQERPLDNDISSFINIERSKHLITMQGQRYINELLERLAETCANVFVPLGDVPLWVLTGLKNVTKRRGSILPATPAALAGRKVIPTIHPAAALRHYIFTHFISYDLKRVRAESESPEINLLQRDLILNPSFVEVMSYISACNAAQMIGFDIEVFNNEISHVSLSISATSSICIPFYDSGTNNFDPTQETEIWLALKALLENPNVVKIGQNITFDCTFVFNRYGIIVRPVEDTMIMSGIAFPDFPKGLDFLTSIYCDGEPYYKDEGKKWFKNPYDSVQRFRRYSAMDSAVLHQCYSGLKRDLEAIGNWPSYKRQLRLVEPLVYISTRGILMDVQGLQKASISAGEQIRALQAELDELVGVPLNVNSPKQVKAYFYLLKGEKPYTRMGKDSVDDTALTRLVNKGYREAGIILEIRHLRKMQGTYYDVTLDADSRLRCSWNPVGTCQGRVSSSKTIFDTGANLQNQPEEMQRLMKADPGMIMVKQDLSQAENRVVAYIANELNMIRAFEEGLDIHKHTASLIYGVPLEEVTKEMRQMGKRSNHGLNYDMGHGRFALLHQMQQREAQYIVERYHTIYPGVRRWHASTREKLARDKRLYNLFGRVRIFMDRYGEDLFKEAYSYVPQSTVAEKLNQALCDAYELPNIDILDNIHDAILYQLPLLLGVPAIIEAANGVAALLATPIEIEGRSFSIPVDTFFGFNAKDMLECKQGKPIDAAKLEAFINGENPC